MSRISHTFAVLALVLSFSSTVQAETPVLSAPEAASALNSDGLVILDIRSPKEWEETGIAKGAWPVSMHEPDFGERLSAILGAYPADQVALICATGGRSAHVTDLLKQNGITGVSDVSEGMLGNARGPGWIGRGLTVVPVGEALADYDAAAETWANR